MHYLYNTKAVKRTQERWLWARLQSSARPEWGPWLQCIATCRCEMLLHWLLGIVLAAEHQPTSHTFNKHAIHMSIFTQCSTSIFRDTSRDEPIRKKQPKPIKVEHRDHSPNRKRASSRQGAAVAVAYWPLSDRLQRRRASRKNSLHTALNCRLFVCSTLARWLLATGQRFLLWLPLGLSPWQQRVLPPSLWAIYRYWWL